MKEILSRLLSLLLCFIVLVQPCFAYSGASYKGDVYFGISSEGVVYGGDVYGPVTINGVNVIPISTSGTMYDGVLYQGIALSEIKVSTIKITGSEEAKDLYSENIPESFRANWDKVLAKFAIGTTVIIVTGVLTLITGGQAGYICAAAFKGATIGAVSGGVLEGIFQGTLSALNGDPSEKIFYETVSGAADGYMWGAITGAVSGAISGVSQLSKGTPVFNSKGEVSALVNDCGNVLDPKTGKIVGYGARQAKKGDYVYYLKNIDGVNYFYDFDGNELYLRVLDDLILDGYSTKTSPIFGIIDKTDGRIYLGDDAINFYNNGTWKKIKEAKFDNLSDEMVFNGKIKHPKVLGSNVEKAIGQELPANSAAHHIVAWDDPRAEISRQILNEFDIDIDSAYNAAILPQGSKSQADILQMAYHRSLHSKKYYENLENKLLGCSSREQVLEVLSDIRTALYQNNLYWL